MIEIPYELELALKTLVNSPVMGEAENQELIFMLYQHENLTWDEIKEKATIPSLNKGNLRECQSGLWVVGFLEMDGEEIKKTYELSLFGRRLLNALLGVMFIVVTKPREDEE